MDQTSSSQLIKNLVGAGARWLLVLIGGILVKKGIISTAQSDVYISQVLPVAIGAAMALLALGWSAWQKRHQNNKIQLALELPKGTSRKTLEKKSGQGETAST